MHVVVTQGDSGNGTAQYSKLAGLDHCGTRRDSTTASQNNCGRGEINEALNEAILTFLKS
jgi:hypothetical protein